MLRPGRGAFVKTKGTGRISARRSRPRGYSGIGDLFFSIPLQLDRQLQVLAVDEVAVREQLGRAGGAQRRIARARTSARSPAGIAHWDSGSGETIAAKAAQ